MSLIPPKTPLRRRKARSRPTGFCCAGLTRCGEQIRNAIPLFAIPLRLAVYIACQALDILAGAADKVSPVRLYMADNGPYSAGCTPLSVLWCCKRDLNPHAPGYEPGALPIELLQQDIRRWVMETGEYFLERDK